MNLLSKKAKAILLRATRALAAELRSSSNNNWLVTATTDGISISEKTAGNNSPEGEPFKSYPGYGGVKPLWSWCCFAPVTKTGEHFEESCCDPFVGYTSDVFKCDRCGKECNASVVDLQNPRYLAMMDEPWERWKPVGVGDQERI